MMASSYHGQSCALLCTSHQLLTNGLAEILARSSDTSASPQDLCRKIAFCVQTAWSRIVKHSLGKLLEKCRDDSQHTVDGTAFHECSSLSTTPLSNLVTNGRHGRQLTAVGPLQKRDKIGEDIPYLVTPTVACGCCEGPLMVEHVTIAMALFRHRLQQSGKKEEDKAVDQMFNHFLQAVSAGFDSTTTTSRIISSNGQMSTDKTIPLMAVVAAVSVCYLNDLHTTCRTSATKSTTATSAIASTPAVANDVSNQYQTDCWMLFQILARLPSNCHAITHLISSSSSSVPISSASSSATAIAEVEKRIGAGESQVSQERLGIALFLTASAANHSCRPNTTVRYFFTTNSSYNHTTTTNINPAQSAPSSSQSLVSSLAAVKIELVATQAVETGQELVISYGPLAGAPHFSHNVNHFLHHHIIRFNLVLAFTKRINNTKGVHAVTTRRRALMSQYQFHCCCVACVSEGDDHGDDNGLLNKTDKVVLDSGEMGRDVKGDSVSGGAEGSDPMEEELRYLATTIGDIQAQVDDLQCCPDAEAEVLLSDKLLPIQIQLSTLQSRHFTGGRGSNPGSSPDASPSPSLTPCLGASIDQSHPMLLRLCQHVYLKFCSVQGRVWDLSAYALSQQGRYTEAVEAVEQSIEAMTRSFLNTSMYPPDDVVVARERVKLGQLLLSSGSELSRCREVLRRAEEDLAVFVGTDDPDRVATKEMMRFLDSQ